MRNKAPFFAESQDYVTLEGASLYQFSDADTAKWIYITATEACTVIRCGKNLMYPIGNMPLVVSTSSAQGTNIMRAANKKIAQEILKRPRTYSFRVSENTISGTGYFQFQENTKEYATGLIRIRKDAAAGKIYITDTTSTVTTNYYGSYYFARKTVSDGESIKIDQYMCAIGNDDKFEPYNGETLTLAANDTVAISALDGINTIIGSAGALTVQYTKKKGGINNACKIHK